VTDDGLEQVASGCRWLEKIDVSDVAHLTDRSLFAMSQLKCIRDVDASYCINLSSTGLNHIVTHNTSMRLLKIYGCEAVGEMSMLQACFRLPLLTILSDHGNVQNNLQSTPTT